LADGRRRDWSGIAAWRSSRRVLPCRGIWVAASACWVKIPLAISKVTTPVLMKSSAAGFQPAAQPAGHEAPRRRAYQACLTALPPRRKLSSSIVRLCKEGLMTRTRTKSRNELLPGTLEMLILKTLAIEPMHGYGIAQHIQMLSADVLTIEEGSLYPALQRMLAKGWVRAEWRTSANNRRARVYTLTTAGKKQLGVEASRFSQMFSAIRRVMDTT
jgi:transcriptional regulator